MKQCRGEYFTTRREQKGSNIVTVTGKDDKFCMNYKNLFRQDSISR